MVWHPIAGGSVFSTAGKKESDARHDSATPQDTNFPGGPWCGKKYLPVSAHHILWVVSTHPLGPSRASMKQTLPAGEAKEVARSARHTDSTQIKRAQEKLKELLGVDLGPLDGTLGPRTKAALCKYQERQGLSVTGVLDEATRKSLGME